MATSEAFVEWLFLELRCICCVRLQAHALPPLAVRREFRTTARVSVPFPVRYEDVRNGKEEDFIATFCDSVGSRLCVCGETGVLRDSDSCPAAFSLLLRRAAVQCDDLVPIALELDVCCVEGESVGEMKEGVRECLERLFRQTITLSDRSGCRLWWGRWTGITDRQSAYRWDNSYLRVDAVENLVYEMNDPQKNSLARQLLLALASLFIVFLFFRLQ